MFGGEDVLCVKHVMNKTGLSLQCFQTGTYWFRNVFLNGGGGGGGMGVVVYHISDLYNVITFKRKVEFIYLRPCSFFQKGVLHMRSSCMELVQRFRTLLVDYHELF